METQITAGQNILKATVVAAVNPNTCVLFLCGGGLKIGKERYQEWQREFEEINIASVSFDYSGVNGSGVPLEQSSLEARINEASWVTDWAKEHVPAEQYVLFGTSMGGYIALGLVNKKPAFFDTIILHAPAAYSPQANNLNFGPDFTKEIRKENSWADSLSFHWLKRYTGKILLVESEKDEVVPQEIIERYKGVSRPEILLLKEAPHDIWKDSLEARRFRNEIYQKIKSFI
jgi:alpha/beta superfamily hydrolase